MDNINKAIAASYFSEFGPHQVPMAASIESIGFCVNLIRENGWETILDAGSGLSTAEFNFFFRNVTSIDDNSYWAQRTKNFIQKRLNISIDITPVFDICNKRFDFVFYDYGDIETRIYYFKSILALSKKAIYIDDMHVDYFRAYIQSKTKRYTLKLLEKETLDQYGRFGAILVRK